MIVFVEFGYKGYGLICYVVEVFFMGIFMKLIFLKRFECFFYKVDISISVYYFLKYSRLSRVGVWV